MPDPKTIGDGNEISRDRLAELLNEDLSREYQAIIAYVVYSQVLSGAQYMDIAAQLEIHAKQELDHALTLSGRSIISARCPRSRLSQYAPRKMRRKCCGSIWKMKTIPSVTTATVSGSVKRSGNMRWRSKFARSWCKSKIIKSI